MVTPQSRLAVVLAVLLAAVACPLTVSEARADEPPPAPTSTEANATARAEYARGEAAFTGGRYREAVQHFLATDRLAPNPALAYNIALAYDSMGEAASALRYYRDYLREVPNAEDRAEVIAAVRRLEGRLAAWGVQQLTVMSHPSGATVSVDAAKVGVTPWTGELTPGRHRVEVTLDGHTPAALDVALDPDRATDVSVELRPEDLPRRAAAPAPLAPAPPSDRRPAHRPAIDAPEALALGAFGLGVGAFAGALLLERSRSNAESDAVDAPTQLAAAADLETIDRRRTAARVAAGVGAALVVTGAVVFTIDRGHGKSRSARTTTLAIGCGRSDCSLSVAGSLR